VGVRKEKEDGRLAGTKKERKHPVLVRKRPQKTGELRRGVRDRLDREGGRQEKRGEMLRKRGKGGLN